MTRPWTSSTWACPRSEATVAYLASLEWITARENLCLVGPAGTGKSHLLVALGRGEAELAASDYRHPATANPERAS